METPRLNRHLRPEDRHTGLEGANHFLSVEIVKMPRGEWFETEIDQ